MPDHWQETTLGQVCDSEKPICYGVLKPGPNVEDGIPLIKIVDMNANTIEDSEQIQRISCELDKEFARSRLDGGEVLLSIQGTVGRVAVVGNSLRGANISRTIARIDSGDLEVNLFLRLWLQYAAEVGLLHAVGTTRASLNIGEIRKTALWLPPEDERRRIVDLVGSIDTYIDRLETQIETTRTARSALLSELLSNPGDDWQETTLGEAAEVVSGGTPRTAEPDFWNGEIVWVTPTEVVANEGKVISDSERKITVEGLAGSSAKMLPVDAVLLTSRATIGAVALAGVPLATNQGFASLVCGDDLTPRFAMYWCQANTSEFLSRAGGNTFLEVSRKKVAAIPLLLPPLEEQRRIVDLVGSIDEQVSSLESQVESVVALRSGVLSELLSGERLLDESYDLAVGI